jgi:pimeloyl-ACP methyl ester carboxylesterase
MKKAIRVFGRILLVILILFVILTIIFACMKKSLRRKNMDILEADGLVNLVSAGDFDMNVNIFGDGKYKIISMPGSGDAAVPIEMKKLSEHLSDDISIDAVTRPGYGISGETKKDVTTEYIVESTRTALKNAGVEAPYILMPHSMSGPYATYWENKYPEEVSGVIFMDSISTADDEFPEEGFPKLMINGMVAIGTFTNKTGWTTVKNTLFAEEYDEYGEYAKDALAFEKASVPNYGEIKNYNINMRTAWDSIQENDIPKVYISTEFETLEDVKEYLMYIYGEVDEELARERFEESKDEWHKEHRKKISEYCKSLGNCEEVNIPGSHGISDQHPEELVKEIEKLIDRIK